MYVSAAERELRWNGRDLESFRTVPTHVPRNPLFSATPDDGDTGRINFPNREETRPCTGFRLARRYGSVVAWKSDNRQQALGTLEGGKGGKKNRVFEMRPPAESNGAM